MINEARLYLCARCQRQVRICSRCDRGQQYCGSACRAIARGESRRATAHRYQQSRRGRHYHAERQRRYRVRCRQRLIAQKVTHHGFAVQPRTVSLMRPDAMKHESTMSTVMTEQYGARCHFCARVVSEFVRLGWRRSLTGRASSVPAWKRR